ncbi:MAG: tRNA lysidine(34) synthetase TilS, partial [Phycisphaerales bacterium]
ILTQYHPGVGDERNMAGRGGGGGAIQRDHPVVARILRRWRELTGGRRVRDEDRRTLVACSGGADSVALAVALATVTPKPVLGHVLHDIRDAAIAGADRESVECLSDRLGCGFAERSVFVRDEPGNLEANARRARYPALAEMAGEHGCRFVATGHHADDQLETVLMHLMRGTGIRGLRGVLASRPQGEVEIVRPMLEVTREEIEQLCTTAGLSWRHDHTNDDHGHLRNRIRHTLTPTLKRIEPDIARRASGLACVCAQVTELLSSLVDERLMPSVEIEGGEWSWGRDALRDQQDALLAELLRVYAQRVCLGSGMDTMGREQIEGCVGSIKSDETDPSTHRVGPMVVRIDAHRVRIEPAGEQDKNESRRTDDGEEYD